MATLDQLKEGLVRAHKAGDTDSARKLAAVIKQEMSIRQENPAMNQWEEVDKALGDTPSQVASTVVQAQEAPILERAGEQLVGAGETALALGTGMTSGAVGMIGGTLKGIAQELLQGNFSTEPQQAAERAQRIKEQAMQGAETLTYAPRTEAGQAQTEAVAGALEPVMAVAPLAETAMMAQAARSAMPLAKAVTREAVTTTGQKLAPLVETAKTTVVDTAKAVAERLSPVKKESAGTGMSAGGAGVDKAILRQEAANELPVPIKLTEGQKTRDFAQQRFERETAKMEDVGAPLRERFAQQREQLTQNIDSFIDDTGTQFGEGSARAVGELLDDVLKKRMARDKTATRVKYKTAYKSEEAKALAPADRKVKISEGTDLEYDGSVVDYINSRPTGLSESGVIDNAIKMGQKLGVLVKKEDGTVSANPTATIKQMEEFRTEINAGLPAIPSRTQVRDATVIKALIDKTTEPVAGKLFQLARKSRARMARDYESVGLIKKLLATKSGTEDRVIALENTVDSVILSPTVSRDQLVMLRRLLQTKTKGEGAQVWKELQAGTLRHIRDQATKSATLDEAGNRIFSPAQFDKVITQLDKNGKLDFVFGKKQAEQLRILNDVSKDVLTSPPGAVNTSNTATVLAGLADVAISGSTGVPAPIMSSLRMLSGHIKDVKLKARVKKALEGEQND